MSANHYHFYYHSSLQNYDDASRAIPDSRMQTQIIDFGAARERHLTRARDESSIRALLIASATHDVDIVQELIGTSGLHPDATISGKPTALSYSVMKPHWPRMNFLLDSGAAPTTSDAVGMTPLHYAVLGGRVACVAALIERGANIEATNLKGISAVQMAAVNAPASCCHRYLRRLSHKCEVWL